MMQCPKCQADLKNDELDSDYPHCPACGSELNETDVRSAGDTDVKQQASAPARKLNDPLAPPQIAGYSNLQLIGSGGMGQVWKARHQRLGRYVAIKMLSERTASDPHFHARFEQEAKVLAQLDHPHIVKVFDYNADVPVPYIVMEYVESGSEQGPGDIRHLIESGTLGQEHTRRLVDQILDALEDAHQQGICHRDIKPGNVLIDRRGNAKVVDFGIAAMQDEVQRDLTLPGAAMGTGAYMAPEQRHDARSVDGRADLFSVGVMLYEMLTLERPIGAFEPPSHLNPAISTDWDEIVHRAMQPRPEQRFQSAGEMQRAIQEIGRAGPAADFPAECVVCPGCRAQNSSSASTCEKCGASLAESCPKCGASIDLGGANCPKCRVDIDRFRKFQSQLLEAKAARERSADESISISDRADHAEHAAVCWARVTRSEFSTADYQSESLEANRHLAKLAWKVGELAATEKNFEKAKRYYELVLESEPNHDKAAMRIEKVDAVLDELLTRIRKGLAQNQHDVVRNGLTVARKHFPTHPEFNEFEAFLDARQQRQQASECEIEQLWKDRQYYALSNLFTRLREERVPIKGAEQWTQRLSAKLNEVRGMIQSAQQLMEQEHFELAFNQARAIGKIAPDCREAQYIADAALEQLEKTSGSRGKKRRGMRRLAFLACFAAIIGGAYALRTNLKKPIDDLLSLISLKSSTQNVSRSSSGSSPSQSGPGNSTSASSSPAPTTTLSTNQGNPAAPGTAPASNPTQPSPGTSAIAKAAPAPTPFSNKPNPSALQSPTASNPSVAQPWQAASVEVQRKIDGSLYFEAWEQCQHDCQEFPTQASTFVLLGEHAQSRGRAYYMSNAEQAQQKQDYDVLEKNLLPLEKWYPDHPRVKALRVALNSRPVELTLKLFAGLQGTATAKPLAADPNLQVVVDGKVTPWRPAGDTSTISVSLLPGSHVIGAKTATSHARKLTTIQAGEKQPLELFFAENVAPRTVPYEMPLDSTPMGVRPDGWEFPANWQNAKSTAVQTRHAIAALGSTTTVEQIIEKKDAQVQGDFFLEAHLIPYGYGDAFKLTLVGEPGFSDLDVHLQPSTTGRWHARLGSEPQDEDTGYPIRFGETTIIRLTRLKNSYRLIFDDDTRYQRQFEIDSLGDFSGLAITFPKCQVPDKSTELAALRYGPIASQDPTPEATEIYRAPRGLSSKIAPKGWGRQGETVDNRYRLISPPLKIGGDFTIAFQLTPMRYDRGHVFIFQGKNDGPTLPLRIQANTTGRWEIELPGGIVNDSWKIEMKVPTTFTLTRNGSIYNLKVEASLEKNRPDVLVGNMPFESDSFKNFDRIIIDSYGGHDREGMASVVIENLSVQDLRQSEAFKKRVRDKVNGAATQGKE